ncbi:EAL domain-containing protein [Rhodanobacter sp. AS-Z3]|uniref:EAL domain-containing protein n=1 Tax=Rhodanobacter sp. AS-Z3 TaxID=3031330 RepID=UPI00247B1729|nr:EAL domain-containing protein [Rhodanobacter sp. AS-Z3]WEN14184.1 EAL domain-containing protein [Rhodanobacter sp. AS-Z3]
MQRSRWVAAILLALVAGAFYVVEIPYEVHLSGVGENILLTHLHLGFLFALAVIYRDRLPLALAVMASYASWLVKMSLVLHLTLTYYAFGAASAVLTYVLFDLGSRWLRRGHHDDWRFSVADVPPFMLFGVVVVPLLLTLSTVILNLWFDPLATRQTMTRDAIEAFFSTAFGVMILGLPLVVRRLSGDPEDTALSWRKIPWRLLGIGVLLPAALLRFAGLMGWNIELALDALLDSRLLLAALLVLAVLGLKLRWSMPLLVMVEFVFAASLVDYASHATHLLGTSALLRIAIECMMLELLVLLLLLYGREREEALQRHEQASLVDPLSGLANLAAFRRDCEVTPPRSMGFLLIDGIAKINAGVGLRAQAAIPRWLAEQAAGIAKTYYFGTGQFLLVLNDAQADSDAAWSRLLKRAHDSEFVWHEHRIRMLSYLGVAGTELPGESLDARILRASEAAIDAHLRGELCMQHAELQKDTTPQERHRRVLELSTTVLSRIRDGEIELHFQPYAPLSSRAGDEGVSGEILCRLRDSDGELMLPGSFLNSLRNDRRMAELDLAVVRRVDRWLREERGAYSPFLGHLCINIAGQSLASRVFARELLGLLDHFVVPMNELCFEVTETDAITHAGESEQLFAALRERGCLISIDDFGVGYQSFERLKQIPVDVIKIDGSFVCDMMRSHRDMELVRATVSVAQAFGAQTVAEYVQDAATATALRELGVDWAQGFHIARPLPIGEAMTRWQAARRQPERSARRPVQAVVTAAGSNQP